MMTIQKPKRQQQKKKDYNKKKVIRKIQKRNKISFQGGKEDTKYTNQSNIYESDGKYFAGPNINNADIEVYPSVERLADDKSTWDFIDNAGNQYNTKYSDDQLKELYGENIPASEFYDWVDKSGKKHRQMKIIPVSPVDPVGEMVVEGAAGAPLFKGVGMVGKQFLNDFVKDFSYTRVGNWLRNRMLSNVLNRNVRSWDGTVGQEYFRSPYNWYRWSETPELKPQPVANQTSIFTDFYKYPDALKYYKEYPEALDQLKSIKSWMNTTKKDTNSISLYNSPKWDLDKQGPYLGEIDYNNMISPYVDTIIRPNFRQYGIPKNYQFTDNVYMTRLPDGIGGGVTTNGKYVVDPINSYNIDSSVLHELGSHGTDDLISPSMHNIYDMSKYLTKVYTPESKLWYEVRATKNEVGKKIFDSLTTKSKKSFDSAIDAMDDKTLIRKFSNINSYGDDIFSNYFNSTPEIRKEIANKLRYMLKYAPASLPLVPISKQLNRQENHNSGEDIYKEDKQR